MPSDATPLAVLLAVAVLGAGCLGGPAVGSSPTGAGTPTSSATPTGTPPPTATPTPGTSTPAGTGYAPERSEPNHAVVLTNDWNRSVTIEVTVVREATNGTVHERTYDVAAGEERSVYDTAEADPDGIERFTVTATAPNATESVTIETSRCYGNVYVEFTSEGELYPYYAIC